MRIAFCGLDVITALIGRAYAVSMAQGGCQRKPLSWPDVTPVGGISAAGTRALAVVMMAIRFVTWSSMMTNAGTIKRRRSIHVNRVHGRGHWCASGLFLGKGLVGETSLIALCLAIPRVARLHGLPNSHCPYT
jgi:hypothetical protein